MGRLRKGDTPKERKNYKFPHGLPQVIEKAMEATDYKTETDFVVAAIKEKTSRILGKKEVKIILDAAV